MELRSSLLKVLDIYPCPDIHPTQSHTLMAPWCNICLCWVISVRTASLRSISIFGRMVLWCIHIWWYCGANIWWYCGANIYDGIVVHTYIRKRLGSEYMVRGGYIEIFLIWFFEEYLFLDRLYCGAYITYIRKRLGSEYMVRGKCNQELRGRTIDYSPDIST